MTKQQKQYAAVGAGVLVLWLAYVYYRSRQSANASTSSGGVTAPDTTSSDYASLAGQEQGDVAALQGQNQQIASTEQSDVAALGAQEGSDVSGLTAALGGLTTAMDTLTTNTATLAGQQNTLGQEVASIASGEQKISRAQTATVATHVGGPFYRYYKQVTGHAPPAHIATSNFIYQAWKSGVKATALAAPKPHPSAPKNTHVAHPNPTHKPQANTAHKLPSSKKTTTASKPKTSGTRK